jgi:hypothetical protein
MSFLSKIKNKFKKKTNSCSYIGDEFELDISWEDISMATQDDDNSNNCLIRAMKRVGLYGQPTECLVVLDDGREFYPQQLSCHWEAYNSSPKLSPKLIKYKQMK